MEIVIIEAFICQERGRVRERAKEREKWVNPENEVEQLLCKGQTYGGFLLMMSLTPFPLTTSSFHTPPLPPYQKVIRCGRSTTEKKGKKKEYYNTGLKTATRARLLYWVMDKGLRCGFTC